MKITNNKKKLEVYNALREEIRVLREKENRTYEDEKKLYDLEYALKNYFFNNMIN